MHTMELEPVISVQLVITALEGLRSAHSALQDISVQIRPQCQSGVTQENTPQLARQHVHLVKRDSTALMPHLVHHAPV